MAIKQSTFAVYGLFDPRTNELRYIGQTSRGAERRLYGHMCDSRRHPHTHTARWIQSLERLGLRPVVRVLETCLFAEMLGDIERRWIKRAKQRGANLTNLTDGGDGGAIGWRPSPETLAKFKLRRHVWRGRKHTEESKRKMAAAQALIWGPEKRAAMSRLHKGKTISVEQRAIVAEKMRGRRRSAAQIEAAASACRKPIADQFGTVYGSLTEAARALSLDISDVSSVVRGVHTRGYVFKLLHASGVDK